MKLKELCKIKHGFAFKGKDIIKNYSTKYVLVTPGNFNIGGGFKKDKCKYFSENGNIPKDYILRENDLIVTMTDLSVKSDTLGSSALIPKDNNIYLHNQRIGLVHDIDESKVLKDYLYWFMRTKKYQQEVVASQSGTAIHHTSPDRILNIEIDLPSIDNQRKIVKILSDVEHKIKNNNDTNNNLYEEAVVLYKDKFKGIGQDKKTIGDYIVPKRGKNLLTRNAIEGDIPVVAGGIEPSTYHNQFNTNSPVITISASGANAGYTNLWNIPVWASDCSYIDDSITKNVYFWYIVLKTRQNEIFDAQTGSAQPHIYPQHIAEMSIGELNIAEVEKYNNLVAPLFKMIGENQKENKKLSQLRDVLLPKLMNGEIDLDNIEI